MGYSANNTDTGALYFGSINPTVTGQEVDNDSFIVTSNGLSSGTPISFWKFDEETLLWVQVPSGGNDGNERKLTRANSIVNIAPTAIEIPSPVNGDTATIRLLNNNIEHWNYTSGVWSLIFTDTSVTVIDNANGTVTVNAGVGNIQDAQRPIMELATLVLSSVDTNADWFDMWDNSAAQMVRVPAMRPSLANYLADGLNDTRTGDIGTTTSGIYAVWNHIHPIIAITAPTPPVIVAGGTGLVIVATTLNSTVTEEECVTFSMTVQCTQTISNAWNTLTVPNIAGYKRPIVTISGMYRNIGNPNLAAGWTNAPSMAIEVSNYINSNTIYLNLPNRTQATEQYISFHIKYVIA